MRSRPLALATALSLGTLATPAADRGHGQQADQGFSFRSGVNLISVTATVTDEHGRFVPNLRAEDFAVYEDGRPQTISQFEAERVPVSLGIALDTSGSMAGDKIAAARAALDRFLFDLLGPQDEVFLFRFDTRPTLIQPWTDDRRAVSHALGSARPAGGTAVYDTVAEAVPLAESGTRRKKALVVISDGNDTSSRTRLPALQRLIRETEVLVYAIGIDASGDSSRAYAASSASTTTGPTGGDPAGPRPVPTAFPGQKPVVTKTTTPPPPPSPAPRRPAPSGSSDRVNADALRAITDDSGGRTEIIVSARDLDPATAGIADELSRQYFIGYVSSVPKDGRWHTIEVRVRGNYTVRARRGFVAN
ncbi:MAG TPA: VWA domain-containing protein [Vicinamibacterales bacterium]|nr:VWA domain-containing protein [Vicinamibacterales bacterium]